MIDGWPLVTARNSPASIHLWELLKAGEQAEIEMRLALPAFTDPLPSNAIIRDVSLTGWGRLTWEQKVLPALVRQTSARLLHSVTGSLPLSSPVPCVYSPTGAGTTNGNGLLDDLQASLGRGGYSRARAILWPEDLPDPRSDIPVVKLPSHAHLVFSSGQPPLPDDLPDEYIFCPGPLDDRAFEMLSAAWGWICAGLGEDWALVVDGVSPRVALPIHERSGSNAPVLAIETTGAGLRAGLMQQAKVVLLVGTPTAWGDPLVQALACGRPVAAEESEWNARRAGPAAYLTPVGDARMLGAAAITLAVEESVAEGLAEAALARAKASGSDAFPDRLRKAYREILS